MKLIPTVDIPELSLIIVTRHTPVLLRRALASIEQTSPRVNKEVIVVDNGVDEETPRMIREEFPQTRYLPQGRNLGFAQANNIGVSHSEGRLICLMNSDARVKPESLSESMAFFDSDPLCGVLGVQLLNTDGSRQNSIANFPTLATELLSKSLLRRLFPSRYPGKGLHYRKSLEVESVIGAFMLTSKSLWKSLKGLDERYFFFLEETDYCLRVQQAGWKVLHLPGTEVWHDQGQTASGHRIEARIEYWRSRYLYFAKHHPGFQAGVLRAGLVFKLCVSLFFNLLLGVFIIKLRNKAREQREILWWHLRDCPRSMGLPR